MKDAQHEDLRQRRTKRFLVTALMELMEERPFQELSVVDICERAMVHRTTFYAHFEDKNALLRYAITELQREFELTEGGEGGTRAYFLAVFQNALKFIRAHKRLYLSGITGGAELRMLEELVAEGLCRWMKEARGEQEPFEPEVAANFYAGAILSTIRWWLEQDMPVDDTALRRYIERLIPMPDGAEKG